VTKKPTFVSVATISKRTAGASTSRRQRGNCKPLRLRTAASTASDLIPLGKSTWNVRRP
jgi:hypothetical protein